MCVCVVPNEEHQGNSIEMTEFEQFKEVILKTPAWSVFLDQVAKKAKAHHIPAGAKMCV